MESWDKEGGEERRQGFEEGDRKELIGLGLTGLGPQCHGQSRTGQRSH